MHRSPPLTMTIPPGALLNPQSLLGTARSMAFHQIDSFRCVGKGGSDDRCLITTSLLRKRSLHWPLSFRNRYSSRYSEHGPTHGALHQGLELIVVHVCSVILMTPYLTIAYPTCLHVHPSFGFSFKPITCLSILSLVFAPF